MFVYYILFCGIYLKLPFLKILLKSLFQTPSEQATARMRLALKAAGKVTVTCSHIFVLRQNRKAGCSSEVERSLMVRWVVGSILHGVDPLSYFSFQPVPHDWCNEGRGMCYPVWDGAYKRTLAVNRGSFFLSLYQNGPYTI